VPIRFTEDIPDMGHLEGSADNHLKAGSTLELPYWLGLRLATQPTVAAELLLPRPFTSRVRNALDASAIAINLRNLGGGGPYFYAGAIKLDTVIDDPTLLTVVSGAFRARSVEIVDQAQHASADVGFTTNSNAFEFVQGLDEWEKGLFQAGEAAAKTMKQWQSQHKSNRS